MNADPKHAQTAAAEAQPLRAQLVALVLIALPLLLAALAIATGAASGALALGGVALLAAIVVLWSSVRLLLGEDLAGIDLSDEHTASLTERDPLLERKRASLAALTDMERERELGKIDQADYDEVVQPLRAEAKDVLRELDRRAEPHRARAEQLIAAHFKALGLDDEAETETKASPQAEAKDSASSRTDHTAPAVAASPAPARPKCSACAVDNEQDAVFCKGCGQRLQPASDRTESTVSSQESTDE